MQLFYPTELDAVILWHQGKGITRAGFTHAVLQLRDRLQKDACTHYINLCQGRLAFMLGLIAVALLERQTLLPSSQNDSALQRLQQQHPQHQLLDDGLLLGLDWQQPADQPLLLNPAAIMAVLHTSGSTGAPQAQPKTWAELGRTGQLDAARFTQNGPVNLVATVPSQHMFGLQTTMLLPLCSPCAIHDSRPFFPADIRAALLAVPAPRALITTPMHLRTCLAAQLDLPELQFILSATAPMPLDLAEQAEATWHTSVLEIYGSTEAGTMATRRTTAGEMWQLIPDAKITRSGDESWFSANHLPQPLQLSDHIEQTSDHQFRLLGRASDQIKIAGKRSTLSEITHALLSLPGVQDAVAFLPDGSERLAALVVAPGCHPSQILAALRHDIDAVFLPRPLLLVDKLPRNEVGKLTRAALHAVLQQARSS